ncbi:MAG: T9SS C-terminal target domain-containing protein, partial [Bacteroidota bacterium]
MKTKLTTFILLALLVFFSINTSADRWVGDTKGKRSDNTPSSQTETKSLLAGCSEPTGSTYLEYNNVKALIHTGGDMWWDLKDFAEYEVPKGSGVHSMFLGDLWLGGTDVNGQLRIAAQRYRTPGVDYWTGPLDTLTAEISPETCAEWDKHFVITRAEVEKHVAWCNDNSAFDGYNIPKSILEWPAHGDPAKGQAYYLAPFYDENNNSYYDPENGDYPYYDLSSDTKCNRSRDRKPKLYGDMTLWWIFNDKGNLHKETESQAIGMEIHAQAFAFATKDEINNMTFTNYIIINRSTFTLIDTYFGTNFDPDIGYAFDDFVGCDVQRGLGYAYNGDAFDEPGEGSPGYGENPPAIGIDFFEGPYMDPDGLDNPDGGCDQSINGLNFGDCEIFDSIGNCLDNNSIDNERWGMRRFIYYNNCNSGPLCDPKEGQGTQYYNYLKGIWLDGTKMVYGGNGHTTGCDPPFSCIESDFMFPGDTDPCGWGTDGIPQTELWTEQTSGNTADDRRFVHSAGPFTLEPGADNDITVGVVWSRAVSTDPFQSVELVRLADDKAQALFDNCFKVLNG